MKTRYVILFIFILMSVKKTTAQQQKDSTRTEPQKQMTYSLDLTNSRLFWKAKKVNGGHNGFVRFQSGSLQASPAGKLLNGDFQIHMNSIVVVDQLMPKENRDVEGVVKASNFFAVNLYPTARMRVKSLVPTGKVNQYKLTGDLTIKGVTKPLEFLAMITKSGTNLNALADLKINRTKWGINYKSGSFFGDLKDELIEDEIEISLKMVFFIQDGC